MEARRRGGVLMKKSASSFRRSTRRLVTELCRRHSMIPRTIYNRREKFPAGGRSSSEGSDMAAQARRHRKAGSLKRIMGEYAAADGALKKRWREGQIECCTHDA